MREIGDDMLILDLESDRIHRLNQTARFIWHNCEGLPSVENLAELLANEFDVAQDTAVRDVTEAVTKLRELNLILAEQVATG